MQRPCAQLGKCARLAAGQGRTLTSVLLASAHGADRGRRNETRGKPPARTQSETVPVQASTSQYKWIQPMKKFFSHRLSTAAQIGCDHSQGDAAQPSRRAATKPERCSCFGERGRLDRRFRRLAENPHVLRSRTEWCWQNHRATGRRDADQGDRDGRAPRSEDVRSLREDQRGCSQLAILGPTLTMPSVIWPKVT
jgi:hypothetical protein